MGIFNKLFGRRTESLSMHDGPSSRLTNWPYPLKQVAGSDAIQVLDQLACEANSTRVSIMLGAPNELGMLCQAMTGEQSPKEIIEIAQALPIDDVLHRMRSLSDEGKGIEEGDWPETPAEPIVVCGHLTSSRRKPLPKVLITTLPTGNAYESPAFLKYGGWNSCPESEYHVALHNYWHQKYGATIMTMTHDIIECRVERRPSTKKEALALAWEHYFYSPDIVTQGTEAIAPLAASLMNSDAWFFWWD